MTPSKGTNILLVSFDDCGAYHRYAEAFGVRLQTPNLDRIVAQSAQFQSAYCQVPICGASRASFMSAQTPQRLNIFDNSVDLFDRISPQEVWSCRLKDAGFFCSSGGKIHHGYKPLRRNLHKVIYSDGQKHFTDDNALPPEVEKRKYKGIRGGWGTTNPKDDGIFYDAQSSASAIDFLQSYDGDGPFYREVGFFSPHGPRYTPARFKDMYDPAKFVIPASWADGFDDHPYTDQHWPQTPKLRNGDLSFWRYNVRNYFAGLSH
ncbi:MAG: sulfatase-like hydrolase/transferase, partial [Alphaproteobacteria bacterium]